MTIEMVLMSVLVFVPVAGAAFIALRNTWKSKEPAPSKPTQPALELEPLASSEVLFRSLAYPFALLVPITANQRDKTHQQLRAAGYYRRYALTEFLALRNVLTFAP